MIADAFIPLFLTLLCIHWNVYLYICSTLVYKYNKKWFTTYFLIISYFYSFIVSIMVLFSSAVLLLHEQVTPALTSLSTTSLARNLPTSILIQDQRNESKPLLSLKEDNSIQVRLFVKQCYSSKTWTFTCQIIEIRNNFL